MEPADRQTVGVFVARVKMAEDGSPRGRARGSDERVEKQGREVRMWKGFEGVIRGKTIMNESVNDLKERNTDSYLPECTGWTYFSPSCSALASVKVTLPPGSAAKDS